MIAQEADVLPFRVVQTSVKSSGCCCQYLGWDAKEKMRTYTILGQFNALIHRADNWVTCCGSSSFRPVTLTPTTAPSSKVGTTVRSRDTILGAPSIDIARTSRSSRFFLSPSAIRFCLSVSTGDICVVFPTATPGPAIGQQTVSNGSPLGGSPLQINSFSLETNEY